MAFGSLILPDNEFFLNPLKRLCFLHHHTHLFEGGEGHVRGGGFVRLSEKCGRMCALKALKD